MNQDFHSFENPETTKDLSFRIFTCDLFQFHGNYGVYLLLTSPMNAAVDTVRKNYISYFLMWQELSDFYEMISYD